MQSERNEFSRMYDGNVWRAYRLGALTAGAKCAVCGEPASELSHKRRHRGCWRDFLDKQNHIALCDDHIATHESDST